MQRAGHKKSNKPSFVPTIFPMNENNLRTFLIPLNLCIFCVIILSKRSSCADYRYEACTPSNCGNGPNISFPFYISGQRESYCGYPRFNLTCTHNGFPVLNLRGYDFVVEDIFYQTKSLRVSNLAFSSLNSSAGCVPRIIVNTTLPRLRHEFVGDVTTLHLFSNCTNSSFSEGLLRSCNAEDRNDWVLPLYETSENYTNALESCGRNVVVPVEEHVEDENLGRESVVEVLRRGFVLNWTVSDCSECESSGGRCGFNETTYLFKCFCPDGPNSGSCKSTAGKTRLRLILITGFAVVLIVLTSIAILITLTKMVKKKKKNAYNHKNMEIFMKNHGNLAPKRYKYSQLKKMTKSFSDNLGNGGYGSVYKGKLLDGHLVAVKILNESRKNGDDFMNEVASISRTSHINIVTLLGFCFEGSKRALIYEFMPNGSLDKFITEENHLGWEKLFEIAVDIARGLEYLHRGCNMRILHLDIKPHNILLDKDFHPKISDFGLAKLCPNRASIVSMSGARGTVGYIAPEVFCRNFGEVSHKSDVYSYGMMVLEIVGERTKVDLGLDESRSEAYFPYWLYKHLELDADEEDRDGVVEEDEKRKLTIVGLWCIQTDPNDRPSMRRVVEMLEGKLESLQIPPKPYLSSPTRLATDVSTYESSI